MKAENHYQFGVTVRPYGGTNIARCHRRTASSTSSEREAVEKAAQKAFDSFCQLAGINPKKYQLGSVPVTAGFYQVNFTRVP